MLKSSLKRTGIEQNGTSKHVTFCKTVKMYTSSFSFPESVSDEFDSDLTNSSDVEPFENGFLVFSWNDNDQETEADAFDNKNSEKPEDFLVHKVVYDVAELMLEDNAQDYCDMYYTPYPDSDDQEFIVHQVTSPERDTNCDETESKADKKEECTESEGVQKICELSIENIEQHNKLFDSLIPNNDDTKNEDECPPDSDVLLSPPLQELGIERLICPQSDSWFWDLDISPLNSVQETDSDSNLSEDTMIMMTSEECEKNEQRIQESFKKFQSLKKLKDKETVEDGEPSQKSHSEQCLEVLQCYTTSLPKTETCDSSNLRDVEELSKGVGIKVQLTNQVDDSVSLPSEVPGSGNMEVKEELNVRTNSFGACNYVGANAITETLQECSSGSGKGCEIASSSHRSSIVSLDSSLSSIEIPQDVREWKIEFERAKNLVVEDEFPISENQTAADSNLCSSTVYTKEVVNGLDKCDELERFVDECTDRVERIRKRYSISEKTSWSPNRGIRPRFGSTAEIVQQMQNNPPPTFSDNHHHSWPSYVSPVRPEIAKSNLSRKLSADSFQSSFNHFPLEESSKEHSIRMKFEEVTESSFQGTCCNNEYCESNCDFTLHASHIPCSILLFHERGIPEGASPPRLSSESLYDSRSHSDSLSSSDSIIHYSMKV